MTYYDDIYEVAVDNHYLFTTADAAEIGVPGVELAKLANRGRLESLGNGVYRLARYVPSWSDSYAVAVARVGKGAYLHGESVVALLGLAPTNPDYLHVATSRRVRKLLPDSVRLEKASASTRLAVYEGVLCQCAADALVACKGRIMPDRLLEAMKRGRSEGYITASEEEMICMEMGW